MVMTCRGAENAMDETGPVGGNPINHQKDGEET